MFSKSKSSNHSARVTLEEQRQPFPMEGTPDAGSGGFEILCITAGVGNGFTPPRFMKSGDIVEAEISKIGILKNTIR